MVSQYLKRLHDKSAYYGQKQIPKRKKGAKMNHKELYERITNHTIINRLKSEGNQPKWAT